ncbi:hypothetical protein VCR5J5_1440011 [Vibrio crassostreae]|uniref:Uncharacterized protein n=1 Tax=Vibrio crassostreae TaxID=246167 RepID=A0A822MPQ2_9VIBR|nr:hypothetical protein VCR5J5_1440011 [Vibrio crassostreae]
MSVLKEINDTNVIARQKIERNMLSFRNALSLMILTRTRDSNLMRNALKLAQSEIRVLALIKLLYPELIQN